MAPGAAMFVSPEESSILRVILSSELGGSSIIEELSSEIGLFSWIE